MLVNQSVSTLCHYTYRVAPFAARGGIPPSLSAWRRDRRRGHRFSPEGFTKHVNYPVMTKTALRTVRTADLQVLIRYTQDPTPEAGPRRQIRTLTCSLELLIKVWLLSIERSHPDGTSSHPSSFKALLISSVCFSIFLSWHFSSLISFLDESTLENRDDCNYLLRKNFPEEAHLLAISLLLPLRKLSGLAVREDLFSWFSLILLSSSDSLFRNHSTVKLSTVSWFGSSFPALSSIRLSSKVNLTGSVGVVLKTNTLYYGLQHNFFTKIYKIVTIIQTHQIPA